MLVVHVALAERVDPLEVLGCPAMIAALVENQRQIVMGFSRLKVGLFRLGKMRLGHVPMAHAVVFDAGSDVRCSLGASRGS